MKAEIDLASGLPILSPESERDSEILRLLFEHRAVEFVWLDRETETQLFCQGHVCA